MTKPQEASVEQYAPLTPEMLTPSNRELFVFVSELITDLEGPKIESFQKERSTFVPVHVTLTQNMPGFQEQITLFAPNIIDPRRVFGFSMGVRQEETSLSDDPDHPLIVTSETHKISRFGYVFSEGELREVGRETGDHTFAAKWALGALGDMMDEGSPTVSSRIDTISSKRLRLASDTNDKPLYYSYGPSNQTIVPGRQTPGLNEITGGR